MVLLDQFKRQISGLCCGSGSRFEFSRRITCEIFFWTHVTKSNQPIKGSIFGLSCDLGSFATIKETHPYLVISDNNIPDQSRLLY